MRIPALEKREEQFSEFVLQVARGSDHQASVISRARVEDGEALVVVGGRLRDYVCHRSICAT